MIDNRAVALWCEQELDAFSLQKNPRIEGTLVERPGLVRFEVEFVGIHKEA